MQSGPSQQVPLTDNEKRFLLIVFRKRRHVLLSAYAICMVMAFLLCPRGNDIRTRGAARATHWEEQKDARIISRIGMNVLKFFFMGAILTSSFGYFYVRQVLAVKRDADSGIKERVPYTIVRKEYFPLTNQYFVAIDDPDYLHHEIDADTYAMCTEGDNIYLERTIKSKLVFEENGRFSL